MLLGKNSHQVIKMKVLTKINLKLKMNYSLLEFQYTLQISLSSVKEINLKEIIQESKVLDHLKIHKI